MPDAPQGTVAAAEITPAELRLAARNHGLPLEALRWDLTPVGLHYLLIHYDIPEVEPAAWRLELDGLVAAAISSSNHGYLKPHPSIFEAALRLMNVPAAEADDRLVALLKSRGAWREP